MYSFFAYLGLLGYNWIHNNKGVDRLIYLLLILVILFIIFLFCALKLGKDCDNENKK